MKLAAAARKQYRREKQYERKRRCLAAGSNGGIVAGESWPAQLVKAWLTGPAKLSKAAAIGWPAGVKAAASIISEMKARESCIKETNGWQLASAKQRQLSEAYQPGNVSLAAAAINGSGNRS